MLILVVVCLAVMGLAIWGMSVNKKARLDVCDKLFAGGFVKSAELKQQGNLLWFDDQNRNVAVISTNACRIVGYADITSWKYTTQNRKHRIPVFTVFVGSRDKEHPVSIFKFEALNSETPEMWMATFAAHLRS